MKFKTSRASNDNKILTLCKLLATSLLWKDNRSKWFQYVSELLSNLQVIAIMRLGLTFCPLSNLNAFFPKLLENFARALSMKDILSYSLKLSPIMLYFVSMYFCLVLCTLGYIVYKYIKQTELYGNWYNWFSYCAQFHHAVIFWPFHILLLNLLFNGTYYTENLLIGTQIFAALLALINFSFGIMSAIFCYHPFPSSNNLFSSHNSTLQTLTFLYKAIICLIIILISDLETKKWLFMGLSLGFAVWRQEVIVLQISYYEYKATKLVSTLTVGAFSTAVTNMIAVILCEYNITDSLDIFFIEVVMLVLNIKINVETIKNVIYKYASLPEERLKTQSSVLAKIIATDILSKKCRLGFGSCSNKTYNQELLFIMGKMSGHPRNEIRKATKNKNDHEKFIEINKESDELRIESSLKTLVTAIKSFRAHNKLKILMAYILLKDQRKFCAAQLALFSSKIKSQTFEEKVLSVYFSQQLEEDISDYFQTSKSINEQTKITDLKKVVDFEEKSNILFKLIKESSQKYVQLWDSFLKPHVPLYEFFSLSVNTEKAAEEIQNLWEDYFVLNQKHLSSSAYLYMIYLTIIRNLPSKARKLFLSYGQKNEGNTTENINLDEAENVIFHVSMSKEKLGRVLHVSRNIFKEFGYNQIDLVNQNIKVIQPPFIKDRHDKILLDHIERKNQQLNQYDFKSFIRNREGYSVPIHCHISIFPYVRDEPIYAGVIQRLQMLNEFMVIGPKGIIEAFSEAIGKDLEIPIDKQIYISEVCVNFESANVGTLNSEEILLFQAFNNTKNQHETKRLSYKANYEKKIFCDNEYIYLYLKSTLRTQSSFLVTENNKEEFLNKMPRKIEASAIRNSDKRTDLHFFETNATSNREKQVRMKSSQVESVDIQDIGKALTEESKKPLVVNQREKINNQDKSPNNKNLRKKQLALYNINVLASSESRTNSSRDRIKLNEKIEEAVNVVAKQKYMRVLNYFIVIFLVSCSSLMCFHMIDSYKEFNSMLQKIELIKACHRRTLILINACNKIRQMVLINQGYFLDSRFAQIGFPNLNHGLKYLLQNDLASLNGYNREVLIV